MILETYKILEDESIVTYAYCRHKVKTSGFICIKYSLRQKLLNLLGLSDYSPVYLDIKIKQKVKYWEITTTPQERSKIDQEVDRQRKIAEELLHSRKFPEWSEIESKIKKYIINEGCSLKESYIRGYEKRGN